MAGVGLLPTTVGCMRRFACRNFQITTELDANFIIHLVRCSSLSKTKIKNMSHIRVKTEYQVEGAYGSTEKRTLYAHHNNSCDVVTFFDEDGTYLFSVEDTMDNNLMDAINRLYAPHKNSSELDDNVQYMDADDRSKCGL